MRRRQLTATLLVVLVAICTLGVPLVYVSVHRVSDNANDLLLRDAESISVHIQDQLAVGNGFSDDRLERITPDNVAVSARLPDGRVFRSGIDVGPDPYSATVQFEGGGVVRVEASREEIRDEQIDAVGVVVGLGAIAAAISVLLAVRFARRLSGPLLRLADHAGRLGAGDFRPSGDRYGVPELDRVASVLDTTGLRLAELVNRERDLVADISHQLRSRLTALSMRLEEISLTSADEHARAEAEVALDQTDRLSGVIDDLLAQARRDRARAATVIDVADELAALRLEWEPPLRAQGRKLEVEAADGLRALATPGRLHQSLGVLVDNALRHGAGTVTVTARANDHHALIEVSDEGPGVDRHVAAKIFERGVSGGAGTGLGLAVARALVDADGGRLELRRLRPATFGVFLRQAELDDRG